MTSRFRIIDAPQRSPEWYAARVGRLTGSSAADMLATVKSGEATARKKLRLRLAVEQVTGRPQENGYTNAAMQRGIECEPLARAAYEALTGAMVNTSGFLAHPELMAGVSLDGHVGDFQGVVELKCPDTLTHYEYLKAGKVPPGYLPQITHALWMTGAAWCDFLSWDDRFPVPTFLVRVAREDVDLTAYELAVRLFLSEVEKEVDAVRGLMAAGVA